MARDIDDYTAQYLLLPFEPIQAAYRRRRVLSRVAACAPKRLLEVGCGHAPLFTDLPGMVVTVVEPSPVFAGAARALAAGRKDVSVVDGFVEDLAAPVEPYDMVIASCVLHEVEDAPSFLAGLRRQCGPSTVLHVNVPNVRSLHRLLAVAMGLISAPGQTSATQRTMQQRGIYDSASLRDEIERAGFALREAGSLFVKPFTHAQMQQLVDQGFMSTAMLDGLDALVATLPELGSEIWAEAVLRHG